MRELRMWFRDVDRNHIVEIGDYEDALFVIRHTGLGTWSLRLPTPAASAANLAAGIDAWLDGERFLSGPVTAITRTRDVNADVTTISGTDENQILADRIVYPDPTTEPAPTWTQAEDVQTGAAETVIRHYVSSNCGPDAVTARQSPGLVMEADQGRGATITAAGRLQRLLDFTSQLALDGGDIGCRIIQDQDSTATRFTFRQPGPSVVTFGEELGNLSSFTYDAARTTGNYSLVGGTGDGNARPFAAASNDMSIVAYGRIEAFSDAGATEGTPITDLAARGLLDNEEKVGIAVTPIDTATRQYGTNYVLSDTASALLDDVPVDLVVREVTVTGNRDGIVVAPTLSTPGRAGVLAVLARYRKLEARMREQERH